MKVLQYINKLFLERGVKVLGYAPQFYGYPADVIMSGAEYKAVPLKPEDNFKFDVDDLLIEIKPRYCIIYIDNPNNPTGQLISLSDIEEIIKEAKKKEALRFVCSIDMII